MSPPVPVHSPYVGWRPYRPEEHEAFFGRNVESAKLADMLIADRIVLLHAPSGTGKTSLVQAGVLPRLKTLSSQSELLVEVLPIVRVGGDAQPGFNRFVYSVGRTVGIACSLRENSAHMDEATRAGWEFAEKLIRWSEEKYGMAVEPVLILDQFEEVFLRDPERPQQRKEFFDFLGSFLLRSKFRALFVIRDDYVGALEPYRRFIPTALESRMRLEPLSTEQATNAIIRPAAECKVTVKTAAAEAILKNLGPSAIEPLHLQVICANIWDNAVAKPAAEGRAVAEIDEADVKDFGDLDKALQQFLQARITDVVNTVRKHQLESLPPGSQDPVTSKTAKDLTESDEEIARYAVESQIRGWLERKLVDTDGIGRVPVKEGHEQTATLDNYVVRELYSANIVGIFHKKSDETWYELAHEKLIAPLKLGNAEWRQKLSGLRRAVQIWERSDRDDAQLATGWILLSYRQEARKLLLDSKAFACERDFLDRSIARDHERRWRRWGRRLIIGVAVVVVALILVTGVGVLVLMQGSYRLSVVTQTAISVTSRSHRAQEYTAGGPDDVLSELRVARKELDTIIAPPANQPSLWQRLRSKSNLKQLISVPLDAFRRNTTGITIDTTIAAARAEWLRDAVKALADVPLVGYVPTRQVISSSPEGLVLARNSDGGISLIDLRPTMKGEEPKITGYSFDDAAVLAGDVNGTTALDGRRVTVYSDLETQDSFLTNGLDGSHSLRRVSMPVKKDGCVVSAQPSATGMQALVLTRERCDLTSEPGPGDYLIYYGELTKDGSAFNPLGKVVWTFHPVDIVPLRRSEGFILAENCSEKDRHEDNGLCRSAKARLLIFSSTRTPVRQELALPFEVRSIGWLDDDRLALVATRDDASSVQAPTASAPCIPSQHLFLTSVRIPRSGRIVVTSELPLCVGREPTIIDSAMGHLLIMSDGAQEGLSSETARVCVYNLDDPQATRCDLNVADARFSPDGHYVATASTQGLIRVWYVGPAISSTDAPPVATMNHSGGGGNPPNLLFLPGTLISFNSEDIRVWQLENLPQSVQKPDSAWHWDRGFSSRPMVNLDTIESDVAGTGKPAQRAASGTRYRLASYGPFAEQQAVLVAQLSVDNNTLRRGKLFSTKGHHFVAATTMPFGWGGYVNLESGVHGKCQFAQEGSRLEPESGERGGHISGAAPTIGYVYRQDDISVIEICDLEGSAANVTPQTVCIQNKDDQARLLTDLQCTNRSRDNKPSREPWGSVTRLSRSGLRLLACRGSTVCRIFTRAPGEAFHSLGFFGRPSDTVFPSLDANMRVRFTTQVPQFRFSPAERVLVIDVPLNKQVPRHLYYVDLDTDAGSANRDRRTTADGGLTVAPLADPPSDNEPLQGYVFAEMLPSEARSRELIPRDGVLFTYSSDRINRYDMSVPSTAKYVDFLRVPDPIAWIALGQGHGSRCVLVVTGSDPNIVRLWNWSAKVQVSAVSHQATVGWAWFVDNEGPSFWTLDNDETSYRIDARECGLDDSSLFEEISARMLKLGQHWSLSETQADGPKVP
jgi:hypothetical protein